MKRTGEILEAGREENNTGEDIGVTRWTLRDERLAEQRLGRTLNGVDRTTAGWPWSFVDFKHFLSTSAQPFDLIQSKKRLKKCGAISDFWSSQRERRSAEEKASWPSSKSLEAVRSCRWVTRSTSIYTYKAGQNPTARWETLKTATPVRSSQCCSSTNPWTNQPAPESCRLLTSGSPPSPQLSVECQPSHWVTSSWDVVGYVWPQPTWCSCANWSCHWAAACASMHTCCADLPERPGRLEISPSKGMCLWLIAELSEESLGSAAAWHTVTHLEKGVSQFCSVAVHQITKADVTCACLQNACVSCGPTWPPTPPQRDRTVQTLWQWGDMAAPQRPWLRVHGGKRCVVLD